MHISNAVATVFFSSNRLPQYHRQLNSIAPCSLLLLQGFIAFALAFAFAEMHLLAILLFRTTVHY